MSNERRRWHCELNLALSGTIWSYLTLFFLITDSSQATFSLKQGVPPSKASLIFNSDSVVVDPGQRLQLDCGVEGNYRYCFWEKEGEQQTQTLQVEDVHGGYIKGLSKPDSIKGNECGIVINSVSANDHGVWTCKVFVFAKTLEGSKRVIVTVKPQLPTLDVNESPLVVSEDELKEVTCTVPAARPPAQIRWFVGTEDITTHSSGENVPTDDKGTYRSASTLRYKFQPRFDRELLKCTIEHPTLQEPERAEVPLDVRFKPYAISSTQIYGIPVAEEYEIKFNFTSNPLPDMRWYVNDGEIPVPGEIGRYMAGIKNLRDNVYMATLRIRDFTNEDVGVIYKLTAKNDLGEKTFDVTLSTGPAPPDGGIEGSSSSEVVAAEGHVEFEDTIGSGTIAAIIVIVVFILILLFIIGMMRYRQMYCFAMRAESKAYIQDPERQQQEYADYANYKINEAVKGSMDQLNGRTATVDTINNGNGTAAGLTTAAVVTVEQQQQQQVLPHQHNYNAIETVAHQHHPMQTEKKNTDV